jgi:hypothetical protein
VRVRGDWNYLDLDDDVDVSGDERPKPLHLKRRWPGVLVLLSQTSELGDSMDALVEPLTEFLVEYSRTNPHVVFGYANAGRVTFVPLGMNSNMPETKIRTMLQELAATIDSSTYGIVSKDLAQADRHLSGFNAELLSGGYRNKLIYIFPADRALAVSSAEVIERLSGNMEITALEVEPAAGGLGREVVFARVPAGQIEKLLSTPESVLSALKNAKSTHFWPAPRRPVR